MLGPFATASRRTPIHQVSLLLHAATVASRLRINVHNDDNNDNDNAWQRGPLWPHRMGPITGTSFSIGEMPFQWVYQWRENNTIMNNELQNIIAVSHSNSNLMLVALSWRTLFSDFQNLTHDICQFNRRSRERQITVVTATRILQHNLQCQMANTYYLSATSAAPSAAFCCESTAHENERDESEWIFITVIIFTIIIKPYELNTCWCSSDTTQSIFLFRLHNLLQQFLSI